ncbi:hypothetical protein ACJ72_03590 [Emergomyces africanus]|uniref:F-box domain-containing protein n=1 Tax=Emergomyces africanus TaxID=1955775 RepID=A0A1B7NZ57_9EURO|nr:hypothetical protein ACJ72_03590 [Emergomyces africanus]
MVSLGSLPPEIVLEIINNLTSASDLISLSLQCRSLSKLAAAHLQLVRLFYRVRLSNCPENRDVYQFFLSVFRNRLLGLYAEHLKINISIPGLFPLARRIITDGDWDGVEHPVIVDMIREIDYWASEITKQIGMEDSFEGWSASTPSFMEEMMMSLLKGEHELQSDNRSIFGEQAFFFSALSLLPVVFPNIKYLEFSPNDFGPVLVLFRIINESARSKWLQNLQHVSVIGSACGLDYPTLEFLQSCHMLSSLRTIRVENFTISQQDTTDYEHPPYVRLLMDRAVESNISKIHLIQSNIPSELLTPILKPPKALEEFKYSTTEQYTRYETQGCIKPTILGDDLRQHKSTLRVLDIDADECDRCYYRGRRNNGCESIIPVSSVTSGPATDPPVKIAAARDDPTSERGTSPALRVASSIGSLHDFTALTHLSIGIKFLLGPDKPEMIFADYWEENYPENEEQWRQQQVWRYNSPLTATPRPMTLSLPFLSSPPSPARRRLIDRLPPKLEFLCIRGFKRAEARERWTSMISEFMARKAECFPRLKQVVGIMEYIPRGGPVVSNGEE